MPQSAKPYSKEMDDGRRKLSAKDHEEVRRVYKQLKSQRATALYFKVSRRLIQWILSPEKLKAYQGERSKKRAYSLYYDKDKQRVYMQRYRAKKRKAGLICKISK
jgi:hypothetical protein